jgi:hypothetical protein
LRRCGEDEEDEVRDESKRRGEEEGEHQQKTMRSSDIRGMGMLIMRMIILDTK